MPLSVMTRAPGAGRRTKPRPLTYNSTLIVCAGTGRVKGASEPDDRHAPGPDATKRGDTPMAGGGRAGGLGERACRAAGQGRASTAGAARLRRARGGEELAHCDGILDRGDHAEPAATARARQHVHRERPPHERGPGPVAPCGRRDPVGRGGVAGGHGGRRPAIAHYLRAPACVRREDSVVDEQVDRGARCQCCQLGEELEGLEHQMRRPIAPRPLQLDRQPSIGPKPQTILGQRGRSR